MVFRFGVFIYERSPHHNPVVVWAQAEIREDKVVVWNNTIPDPAYIRYAWADNPVNPNLYNVEGLPASPFEIVLAAE